jgi:hypothetical protein
MILIVPASPSVAIASASRVTWESTPCPLNLSSCFSTACYLAQAHVSAQSTSRTSTSILPCLTLNMSALKLQSFWQNSLRSTKSKVVIVTVGFPLKFARAIMAFPRPAFLPTISADPAFLLKGYYKAESAQGLWCHKWHPIQFCLIVDDFGVEYVGLKHFNHLHNVLKKFYGVQFNMAGNKFVDMTSNETTQPAGVASVCPAISIAFSSSLNIPVQLNPISCCTNACQLPMVLRPNSPQQPILQSNLTYTKNATFKRLSDCSSTTLKQSPTSSW